MEQGTKKLQVFRNDDGIIVCIKCGWIAVDVPEKLGIMEAEVRGTSHKSFNGIPFSFYDIALDGDCLLHVFRMAYSETMPYGLTPYFTEKYPF